MLRNFKVSNFKCFEKEFELDLSKVSGYEFNKDCIKNNTINTALIYGYNGCGKSNLALAVFDIIEHLTDKNKNYEAYQNYLCAYSKNKYAKFEYEFLFNNITVKYIYLKSDYKTIVSETLEIDNELVISYDRRSESSAFVKLEGAESLNKEITNSELSVLKYVINNSQLVDNKTNKAFYDLMAFVDSMLFFRSLEDRTYLGFKNDSEILTDIIIKKDKVQDFERFLNDANIDCTLEVIDTIDGQKLALRMGDNLLEFNKAISTGTSSLTLFYYWYLSIVDNEVSFLFIDEFDAFYHHELSGVIVKKLIESGVQCILTSHNTTNLTNDLLRPDCYFIMNKRTSMSLANSTDKELRKAHNIEKMYKAGSFDVK